MARARTTLAELERARRDTDEAVALYKDLQARAEQWLAQANGRADRAEQQRDEVVAVLADLVWACEILAGLDPDATVLTRALGSAAIAERATVARQLVERHRRATREAEG